MKGLLILFTLICVSAGAQVKSFQSVNYSIQYPELWDVDTVHKNMADVFFLSPLSSDTDKFRENVGVGIQNLHGMNVDLDKFVTLSENQIKTLVTNGNIIESRRVKYAEGEFHKIIFTGLQGVYHLKFEQYYFIYKEKAFVITFTAEENKFDDYVAVSEKILGSFKLMNW